MTATIEVGNAPVSYGAFERTVGIDPDVPDGLSILEAVSAAGYRGIDLGPLGYLGDLQTLPGALARRRLLLTGAYLEVDVSSKEGRKRGLAELETMLDLFDALGQVDVPWRPRPTVAAVDGNPSTDRILRPDRSTWEAAISVLHEIAAAARHRGYDACLHNEVGTLVATDAQIEEAATAAGMAVCLDTGHLLAAGGDPLPLMMRLGESMHHVHLKDVTAGGLELMVRGDAVSSDVWAKRVFCPLGAGVGRIAEVVALLSSMHYSGWVVVEQDVLPQGSSGYKRAAEDQVTSREFLSSLGL